MSKLLAAKGAAEKLSLRELKILRVRVGDLITKRESALVEAVKHLPLSEKLKLMKTMAGGHDIRADEG